MRWRDFDSLPPLSPDFFSASRRVHFIGIGGIGMSALAFVLASRGHAVSGSDVCESETLTKLRAAGILAAIGHRAENLDLIGAPCDALIFSSAVAPDNPERQEAARRGVPVWHRAQLLAYFVNTAKRSIAVSGTHGKSTTSAMVAHILTECGHNPTAILGAVYPPFDSNARIGDPDLVVVEADESDGSFTLLHPTVSVILNVEAEHLENYDESEERLWEAFGMFAGQATGNLLLNASDEELCSRLAESGNVITYDGVANRRVFKIGVPGKHNLSNARAAVAATKVVGIFDQQARGTLKNFNGIGRRFEKKGEAGGVVVYDDYGHHPTEVARTLEAARDFLGRRLVVIFQPHRYSRTQSLGPQFGPAFAAADEVIITQLYSAFEEPIPGVSGEIVFDAVKQSWPDKPVAYAETLDEALRLALRRIQPGDALFTMGAGDITTLGPRILQALSQLNEHHETAGN